MKLWVDDIRKEPEGWTRARSVTEAIRILDTMPVFEVSLDYDISMKVSVGTEEAGYSEPRPFRSNETFEPVARFISARYRHEGEPDDIKITLHTANPVGAERMKEILINFDPKIKLSSPCNRFEEIE